MYGGLSLPLSTHVQFVREVEVNQEDHQYFSDCVLSSWCYDDLFLAPFLQIQPKSDLSNSDLEKQEHGDHPGCTLQELSLPNCGLASILKDDVVVKIRSLTKLHLQYNPLEKCAIKPLCEALRDPGCTLQELRLSNCHLSSSSCEDLRSVLITSRSLAMLDLSENNLQDSGVRVLCEGLRHPGCVLRDLNLSSCKITSLSCDSLGSVFINQSLIKLNLDSNQVEDSGMKLLCQGLGDPGCTLRHLSLRLCQLTENGCEALRSIFFTNRSLTNLDLTHDRIKDSGIKLLCEGLKHPDCTLQELRLSFCNLTPLCCEHLSSVLATNRSLIKLDLSSNHLNDSGLRFLCEGLGNPACTLQELRG
ncbi:ribonuclease inhibitor-like [Gastrophryne carolinensis]